MVLDKRCLCPVCDGVISFVWSCIGNAVPYYGPAIVCSAEYIPLILLLSLKLKGCVHEQNCWQNSWKESIVGRIHRVKIPVPF